MFLSSPPSQTFWFRKEHVGSVGTLSAGEGSCSYSLSAALSSRGPAQLKVRAWRVRGQAFLQFLGTVSAASHPYLMASSTQGCRGAGGEPSWLLLQNWNAWSVLQQPWGSGLLGNPPDVKRQCKERQEPELEKTAPSHPCYSHGIFYPRFSKADHS